jgi:hypothetical protein
MNVDKATKIWFDRLDAVSSKLDKQFSTLTHEQLNWKLSEEKWSIAEVLQHLNLVNASYEEILTDSANGKSDMGFTGKIGFVVNFLGDMIYKSVEPTRASRTKTFPVWEPVQNDVPKDVITDFKKQQEAIKKLITDNKSLLEKDVVIPSPANRYIVYKLRKAIEIIVSHEERHLNQAMEAKSLINLSA